MTVTRAIARPMLAGMFVYGGWDAVRNPESKVPKAEKVTAALAEPLGLPSDTAALVRVNGAVQMAGGTLLALGKAPRMAATALALSLVPTTYAGHRFWEESDPAQHSQQRIQFLKNVSMLGGLVLAAVDTGGRPSVTWRARRAAKRARKASKAAGLVAHGAVSRISRDTPRGAAFGAATAAAATMGTQAAKKGRHASKSATKAARHATKVASRATKEAANSPTAEAATRAARRGLKRGTGVAERARDAARDAARQTSDRTREAVRDANLDKVRDAAVERAREGAERFRESLPIAG